ncbi:MAG: hypothetical protein WBK55_00970 [Alphaproteobacteria bacterium]
MSNSKNSGKRRAWTPARRTAQGERIRAQKPWKAKASRPGLRRVEIRAIHALLRCQKACVEAILGASHHPPPRL